MDKLIKDPVHGYIKIEASYLKRIVDTQEFQRLRNIRQTGYDSLYPGASHNRFIHSLGVYHLGKKAMSSLYRNSQTYIANLLKKERIRILCLQKTFEIGCLLHDIGHTPFSHTGEDFLLVNRTKDTFQIMRQPPGTKRKAMIPALYEDLLVCMKKHLPDEQFRRFKEDFSQRIAGSHNYTKGAVTPKSHEIMSVIIAVEQFRESLNEIQIDYELLARMILGLPYEQASTVEYGIRNSMVQLLNSSLIDVDRLDYIMRDMQMSGFDNVSIDIERLLQSVCMNYDAQKQEYIFAYQKTALSTIENVILAYDAERKWIQGHPVIIYDGFLLGRCIEAVNQEFLEKSKKSCIFQKRALTPEGVETNKGFRIRLMNDGDFLFLMKQISRTNPLYSCVEEYLSRDKRRSPIWKSAEEFSLLIRQLTERQKQIFIDTFAGVGQRKGDSSFGTYLNNTKIEEVKSEIQEVSSEESFDNETKKNKIRQLEKQLFWLERLRDYFINRGMDFNIHNEKVETFKSKVNILGEKNIRIQFTNFGICENFSEVFQTYKMQEKEQYPYIFYWYIYKERAFDTGDFVRSLKQILEDYEEKYLKNTYMKL